MTRRLLVIGAGGDIGQGLVRGARARGWHVVAALRDPAGAARFADDAGVATVTGEVSTEGAAAGLFDAACPPFDGIDAVAVAVNAANTVRPLMDWTMDGLAQVYAANLLTHFNAIKTMLPRLPDDGMLVGIGGGTADFILPKMAQLSMMQAAQRMMYRGFARERTGGAEIRELMIVSMVNGARKRDVAKPDWLMDVEVGEHVCAMIADPPAFADPIQILKSRDQVGRPADAAR